MEYLPSPSQDNLGFTIIEILVSLSIMTVVFALGFANYRDFARRQQLDGIVQETRADLRQAQQQALGGKKPTGCVILDGYRVRRVSPTGYVVDAMCSNEDYEVKYVEFSSHFPDITIEAFPDLIFNVLARGVNTSATITFTQGVSGDTRQIQITQAGEIQ